MKKIPVLLPALLCLLFILFSCDMPQNPDPEFSTKGPGDSYSVTGKVYYRISLINGALANAELRLSNGTAEYTALSDEAGDFSISAPEGTYTLTAWKSGYRSSPAITVVISSSGKEYNNFWLMPTVPTYFLLGTIYTSDESRIPDAPITIVGNDISISSVSDLQGNYESYLPAGTYTVTVFGLYSREVEIVNHDVNDFNITVQ